MPFLSKVKMMIHSDRVFSFKEIESEDDLVEAMANHTWPLCYSFYHGRLLFLSDGDDEADPEYAVVTIDKTEGHHGIIGREVGRIKPKDTEAGKLRKVIQEMKEGRFSMENPVRVQAEPIWHHSCQHCRLEDE